jgi:hypothetical protein
MSDVDNAGGGAVGGAGSSGTSQGGLLLRKQDTCKSFGKPRESWCPECLGKRGCTLQSDKRGLSELEALADLPVGVAAASHEPEPQRPEVQGRHQRVRSADWQEREFAPPEGSLRDRGGRNEQRRGAYTEEARADRLPLDTWLAQLAQLPAKRSKSFGDLGAAEASQASTPPAPQQPRAIPARTSEAGA